MHVYHGRRTAAALALLAAAPLLGGCLGRGGADPDAGTNGVAKLPARTIEQKAGAAAQAAPTVRISGTVVSGGQTYRLDMRLRADGGVGEVTAKGATFQLLRVGGDLYLKAGADFYGTGDDKDSKAAAAKLNGKYVKVPVGDPAYQRFSGFTDKKVLLADLFVLDGTLEVGARRTVGTTKTIELTGSGGGILDVSLQGSPYPLRYQRAGNAGTLALADWGEDFTLAAPARSQVVDYGKTVGATPTPSKK